MNLSSPVAERPAYFTEPPVSPGAPALEPPPITTEPDVVVDPVALPEPEAPSPVVVAEIFLRLSNDERISAGTFESEEAAEARARELMTALDEGGDWPRIEGRYVRPEAVVSIDVEIDA
jgi:hypothetical protein